ncbi:hypothetical protein V9L05_17180 [Bernardetia sp. Wsw4-3y2]|uniref:hypothetical protein n=1 Tax=Bernardetia sp. Wsw4-3y2 TaxID=3127471 RepID=UPI0030D34BCF
MHQYSIIVINNSTNTTDFCVYQKNSDKNLESLAWLTKRAHPDTRLVFKWQDTYCFFWSETGTLSSGTICVASQICPAELSTSNQIRLEYTDGAYQFMDQQKGSTNQYFYVIQDDSIPANKVSVGIGMSEIGTFIRQGQPNLTYDFLPEHEYWITFGNYTEGQVLDTNTINNAIQIIFPTNVYSMTVILEKDNTWKTETTSIVNEKFLAARKRSRGAIWGDI